MTVYEGWDGEGDYEPPVKVGETVLLVRPALTIIGKVEKTDGFFPDIVALTGDLRVDLRGMSITRVEGGEIEVRLNIEHADGHYVVRPPGRVATWQPRSGSDVDGDRHRLLDQLNDLERERDAALVQRAAIAEQWAADKVAHKERIAELEKRVAEREQQLAADPVRWAGRVLLDAERGDRVVLPVGPSGGTVYVPIGEFRAYQERVDAEVGRYRDALGSVRGAVSEARRVLAEHDVAAVFPHAPRPTGAAGPSGG